MLFTWNLRFTGYQNDENRVFIRFVMMNPNKYKIIFKLGLNTNDSFVVEISD